MGAPMTQVCKLMALIAVLLMPFGMSAAASAAPSADHAMAGMPMGHCPDEQSQTDSKPGIAACTMVCSAALPAIEPRQPTCGDTADAHPLLDLVTILTGLHPEAATPPPRLA